MPRPGLYTHVQTPRSPSACRANARPARSGWPLLDKLNQAIGHQPSAGGEWQRSRCANFAVASVVKSAAQCVEHSMELNASPFCRLAAAPTPYIPAVGRPAMRQNGPIMSRKTGTPAATTKPNRWPNSELAGAAQTRLPTKCEKRRAPRGSVTSCRQLVRQKTSARPAAARDADAVSPPQVDLRADRAVVAAGRQSSRPRDGHG
jgi:hypothetical protein